MSQSVRVVAPSGLVQADFAFRLYRAGVLQTLPALAVAEHSMATASTYLVTGLPTGSPGDDYVLTWNVEGSSGSERWREPREMTQIVLALRTDGIVIGDLDLLLMSGGTVLPTTGLTLAPIGPSPTDYLLSGMPAATVGQQNSLTVGMELFYQVDQWPAVVAPNLSGRSQATVENEVYLGHLRSNWLRSRLADFEGGVSVDDPGYGHDEISPVTYLGQPFNVETPAHVAPFTPTQVAERNGTGYLRCLVQPRRPPETITPGFHPEMAEQVSFQVTMVTPSGRGPKIANSYAGALAMLYSFASWKPGEAGITIIRNLEPPPKRPTFVGDDGTWRYDQLDIPLTRYFRAIPAGAQN